MLINPQETIHLAYNISDPTDTTTYFPKAVMRDSATGKSLGTANLTQDASNTRRYTGSIQAPSQTGNGRYIDIILTVYTDAGHTAISPVYQEILWNYIVAYRWNQAIGGAGNGDPFQVSDMRASIRTEIDDLLKKYFKGSKAVKAQQKLVVQKTRTNVVMPDLQPLKDELMTYIANGMKNQSGDAKKNLKEIERSVVAALEGMKDIPQFKDLIERLDSFDGLMEEVEGLKDKLSYIWENDYLTKMQGDGSLLPPVASVAPRGATKGVMPVADVMASHAKRQAKIFGGTDAPVAPASPEGNPILGEPEFAPSSKRKPSEGVIPHHTRALNAYALTQLPS